MCVQVTVCWLIMCTVPNMTHDTNDRWHKLCQMWHMIQNMAQIVPFIRHMTCAKYDTWYKWPLALIVTNMWHMTCAKYGTWRLAQVCDTWPVQTCDAQSGLNVMTWADVIQKLCQICYAWSVQRWWLAADVMHDLCQVS